MLPEPESTARFSGLARLFSPIGLDRLQRAHVCVVGIGGVGSWAVEALARSGVGALTLVDLDDVCVSNVNRQLHALEDTVGQPKAAVMAQRVRGINPHCEVQPAVEFLTPLNIDRLLATPFTAIIDAIDDVPHKCLLIARSREGQHYLVACGAAGGRRDPTAVRVRDLAHSSHDRLLAQVRRRLRADYGFPRTDQPFGVDCVFSTETPVFLQPDGTVCAARVAGQTGPDLRLDCDAGLGTASFVTGAFGLAAAGRVVRRIVDGR